MPVHRLKTVDAFVAFDFDDAATSAGGTRLAPDVTETEAVLLARAMTYKFGVLRAELGGAKGGIRASANERESALARYCDEIRPLVESRRFLTGPDLGTSESDFASLRQSQETASPMAGTHEGMPLEDVVTGLGVVVAAEAALGSVAGCSFAIEGFGKVGGGVAREAAKRGGRVVAVSTVVGAVQAEDGAGLDVEEMWSLRGEHGDSFVSRLGLPVLPPAALFDVAADVLVPGARTGVLDARTAAGVNAGAVVPASNVPYTGDGLNVLVDRAIPAHADFVCNAGAVIGYRSPAGSSPEQVFARVENEIRRLVLEASEHPEGPFQGAVDIAANFIRTWREEVPPPPLA